MLLEEEAAAQANAPGSDDEEMKIHPKEVVEEVAEKLALHLVWEDPNVNKRAIVARAQMHMKMWTWIVPEFD